MTGRGPRPLLYLSAFVRGAGKRRWSAPTDRRKLRSLLVEEGGVAPTMTTRPATRLVSKQNGNGKQFKMLG